MKIHIAKAGIFFLVVFSSINCTGPAKKMESQAALEPNKVEVSTLEHFEMIDELKSETPGKAQLLEYAVYTDTLYTEEALNSTLMDIYNRNRSKDVFDSHNRATVIGVYLFTSKKTYEDKSNWIAMLIKGPNDSEPYISYNCFKVKALREQRDQIKSKDEIELEKLNRYLGKRGLELCSFSAKLLKMEQDHIDEADASYPDFGPEHLAMVDRLDEEVYRALKKKYKLTDDMLTEVHVFAMSYCK